MKAVVVREWSDPQRFTLEERDVPLPGAGELLVAIHTAAINFGDTLIATGRYQVKPSLPFTPGTECSGIVLTVGQGVDGFDPGDPVAACGFIGDARKHARILGSFAEQIIVPVANALKAPAHIPLDQLALFRSNAETSLLGLQKGRLAAGETLLVLGAGGGTGLAAVQLGKIMGARVIASASSDEKRGLALAAGADVAIDSQATDWRDQVRDLTDRRGIDVVYDPVGGEATERAFRALAWDGRLVVIGFAAGPIPAIPANLALLKGASMVGVNLLEALRFEPERVASNRSWLMTQFGEGRLTVPPIARRYALSDAAEALRAVSSGEIAGCVVVDVAGSRKTSS
jgi:NADPH2:quinone reductase